MVTNNKMRTEGPVELTGRLLRLLSLAARASGALPPRQDDAEAIAKEVASLTRFTELMDRLAAAATELEQVVERGAYSARVGQAALEISKTLPTRRSPSVATAASDAAEDPKLVEIVVYACREAGLVIESDRARAVVRAAFPTSPKPTTSHGARQSTRAERIAAALCRSMRLDVDAQTVLQIGRMRRRGSARSAGSVRTPGQAEALAKLETEYGGQDDLMVAILAVLGRGWHPAIEDVAAAAHAAHAALFPEFGRATPAVPIARRKRFRRP